LMMGMLISSFSLPDDIKNKTIYTIVTKPVRATEIVLGRIVGFGLLGTGLLALMGAISYVFVWQGLDHGHQIVGETQTVASFVEIGPDKMSVLTKRRASENAIMEAITEDRAGHRHRLEVLAIRRGPNDPLPIHQASIVDQKTLKDGSIEYHQVVCLDAAGHKHKVTVDGQGRDAKITIGGPIGYFRARMPIYSDQLVFYDRDGEPQEKGINVGHESDRRSFVSGGTARARTSLSKIEMTFDDFYPGSFPNLNIGGNEFVTLEMNLGIYRTFKANIEKRVTGGLQFESVPSNDAKNRFVSDMQDFETKEFAVQTRAIPRKIAGKIFSPDGKLVEQGVYDLFDDFAENGKIRLFLSCRDYNQYIGVAPKDIYFRPGDASYGWNFAKGYFGIWCQMMVIISIGVALSASLSAPITMLGTIVIIILGYFSEFISGLAKPDTLGGGPIESMIRVVTQKNMMSDLDTGVFVTLIKNIDYGIGMLLYGLTFLTPDFSRFNFADDLATGYSIGGNRVLIALALTMVFCFGFTLLGYFSLKTREIAK